MAHEKNPNAVGPAFLGLGLDWRGCYSHALPGHGLPGLRLGQPRSWGRYVLRCVLLALSAGSVFGCASLATNRGIQREAYQRGLVRTDTARANIEVQIPGFSGASEVDLPPPPSIPRVIRLPGDTVETTVYVARPVSQDTVRFDTDSLSLRFWQTPTGKLGFRYHVKPRVITREVALPCETIDPPKPTLPQRIWADFYWYLLAFILGSGVALYARRRFS